MKSTVPAESPFVSVFDHVFDAVVFGAGFIGFASARALANQGVDTLLVEASGDLLWESTRALENTCGSLGVSVDWDLWVDTLRIRKGANDRFFDPALAEILSAHALTTCSAHPRTLLYASPVTIETTADDIASVIVATKSGPRRLHARHWIDATEQGIVARLAQPSLTPRAPQSVHRSLVLHTLDPEKLDAAFPQLRVRHPGLEWCPSVRTSERRLRWPVSGAEDAWHRKVPALVTDLRTLLSAEGEPTVHFVVSHGAMRDFPVYAAAPASPLSGLPANLLVASPALRDESLVTPADRFSLGCRIVSAATSGLEKIPPLSDRRTGIKQFSAPLLPAAAETMPAYDVLVGGAGTGGAVAAIVAARNGARTLAFDFTPYPGGIGTGAGICSYFHGAKGGLQSEIDERVRTMTTLLNGAPAGLNSWHHEAKKIVLLSFFDEAGVRFLGDVLLAGVERDTSGRVLAALAVIAGRLTRLPAAAFIDGTGDGDLAAFAGAEFATGRPGDGRMLAYSQSIFSLSQRENRLELRACNFDAGWVDPTDPEDLSRARLAGIAQHLQPDWTQSGRAVAVSPLLGLRQSRQIKTDYQVTMADLVDHARFNDSIGEVETVADTHSVDFEFETDELAFYYWTCRGFRHPLHSELPYRMLLPRGLTNLWIACRAAGIEVDAAYGLRMQREMQRLGETAGISAALAVREGTDARGIDLPALQRELDRSGCRHANREEDPVAPNTDWLASLDQGMPGVHLWHLFRQSGPLRDAVHARLASDNPRVSFHAAVLLAMWNDAAAEPRLLAALQARDDGPTPEEHPVPGAFGQCIDIPFWLQAVLLLRRVGTTRCLPGLRDLAATPANPLNIRTLLALTLERIATRVGAHDDLISALDALFTDDIPDALLPPSRSLWRTLHREPQKKLTNDRGAPVAQDHTWQLHLIGARTRRALKLAARAESAAFLNDPRAFVRQAFSEVI